MSQRKKINLKDLRDLKIELAQRGMTVSDLAKKINRSRQAVYFAIDNPSRFSEAHKLIVEALQ